jgi:xylan 1,4-beta-xylosidase
MRWGGASFVYSVGLVRIKRGTGMAGRGKDMVRGLVLLLAMVLVCAAGRARQATGAAGAQPATSATGIAGTRPATNAAGDQQAASARQDAVTIRVDAAATLGALEPIWAYFGYDEPNYTTAAHGRELIAELTALSSVPVHLRTHNLLTTGDGTPALKWGSTNAYTEDAAGKPVYDWKIVDAILDTQMRGGNKPFVEIGFMPEALSVKPEPYKHTWPKGELYTGWSYPPANYEKWGELVRQWVLHCVERYGAAEVASWNWEVWNEPDIAYWHGTAEEYDKLYDYAADAVKRALPAARVGGPATTGPANAHAGEYLRQFLEHCARGKNFATGRTGAPLDFVSFHAKGSPKFTDGHVVMGIASNLASVDRGLAIVGSFPGYAKLPIVLSESDPDGCAACAGTAYPQNAYRNGTMYPAFTAAILRGTLDLAEEHKANVAGLLTWAFEFEDQPYFEGYRTLATNGVDKPELNFFRMAGLMHGERIAAESSGAMSADAIAKSGVRGDGARDVDALAARAEREITVMVWNYQDEDVAGPDSAVVVKLAGVPRAAQRLLVRHYGIDRDHSNSYTAWLAMGSPQNPTAEQIERLKAAGQLQLLDSPSWVKVEGGSAEISFALPREAVSLVELSW